MPRKNLRIRTSQKRFIEDSPLQISPLIRNALDDAMAGERDTPTDSTPRSRDDEYEPTQILIDDAHETFIQENDINLSRFVDNVIQERIERERRLNELDEDQ